MPRLLSIGTAIPRYSVPQQAVQERVRDLFHPAFPAIERYLPVFRHARIETRQLVRPLEWWDEPRSFGECNRVFIEEALILAEEAIEACLQPTGLTPAQIDHLFVVTTTGLAAPSLDALLIDRLGMGRHTRRTPIWGLGCAGGLGGLARANEYVRAEPGHYAVLVNIEFCSLTFLADDLSKRNLIATSLFGDGVTAVLVGGDETELNPQAPQIIDSMSTVYPQSADIMGWKIVDRGFEVVFSSRIPSIVRDDFAPLLDTFLERHQLSRSAIERYILHPGGAKVINAYQTALDLSDSQLEGAWNILRDYGNMSSATIFFVLDYELQKQHLQPHEPAVMAVFGPGFTCELMMLRGAA